MRHEGGLALRHLQAAARFARGAKAIEVAGGAGAFDEVFSLALGCMHACVAAVEAYANGIARDPARHFPDVPEAALVAVMRRSSRDTPLEKLDLLLTLRGHAPLHRGKPPVQDFVLLGRLRNHLVHFQPDWDWVDPHHAKLSRQLADRFEKSRLVDDDAHFPRAWATHAATVWAVTATHGTLALVEEQAGWPARASKVSLDLG